MGFIEGRNVVIEYRWAEGQFDRMPAMAADLINRKVSVILVGGNLDGVRATMEATQTIPVVFTTASDPVGTGLVASLSRPDSNLTGATTLTLEVAQKWVQLVHEIVPKATSLALLINPTSPNLAEAQTRDLHTAARTLGLQIHVLQASSDRDFDTVFASLAQLRAGALVITSDSFFFSRSEQLAALAKVRSLGKRAALAALQAMQSK